MRATWILLLLAFAAPAQQTPPVESPEVRPDRSVTFRILAPKAGAVTFYGDWMPVTPASRWPRTKAASGR